MADLLTHVLVAYTIGILLSVKYTWINSSMVTAMMVGSAIPDLTRVGLIVQPSRIEDMGIPFAFSPIHTLAGSFVIVLILACFVDSRYFKPVVIVLTLGMLSHHILDLFLMNVSGYSYAIFWPATIYQPPAFGPYMSTDMWPAVIALLAATLAFMVKKHLTTSDVRRP